MAGVKCMARGGMAGDLERGWREVNPAILL